MLPASSDKTATSGSSLVGTPVEFTSISTTQQLAFLDKLLLLLTLVELSYCCCLGSGNSWVNCYYVFC